MRVVEAGILSFASIEGTVEAGCLMPHLKDEITMNEFVPILRISGLWVRKQMGVHQIFKGDALHLATFVSVASRSSGSRMLAWISSLLLQLGRNSGYLSADCCLIDVGPQTQKLMLQ